MNIEHIIIEIVGYIAVILNIWSFSSHNLKTIFYTGAASIVFYIINIYFSGSDLGTVIIAFIGLLTYFFGLKLSESKRILILKIIPIVAFIIFAVQGFTLLSFFAALGTFFASSAKMVHDILLMKIIFLGSAFSWLIIGILIDSIPAILFDVTGIIALLISIYRLKKSI